MQQRIDPARAEHVRGFDHVTGCVARSGQRGRELGVGRLGCGGRRKPEGRLARGVEPVLQPAQRADRLVVVEQVGSSRNPLEPGKRLRELAPELADLGGIALRPEFRAPRSASYATSSLDDQLDSGPARAPVGRALVRRAVAPRPSLGTILDELRRRPSCS